MIEIGAKALTVILVVSVIVGRSPIVILVPRGVSIPRLGTFTVRVRLIVSARGTKGAICVIASVGGLISILGVSATRVVVVIVARSIRIVPSTVKVGRAVRVGVVAVALVL